MKKPWLVTGGKNIVMSLEELKIMLKEGKCMNFDMKNKMKICAVIDRETNLTDEKYSYRVGRKCYLPKYIKEGESIQWMYEDGSICTSSLMESYDEDDYGVWIHTKHRSYDFQYVYEDKEKEVKDKYDNWQITFDKKDYRG